MLKTRIDFMGRRKLAMAFSLTLILTSLVALFVNGLNFGLDFTGGTLVEVEFDSPVAPEQVRQTLEQSGFSKGIVQNYGTETDLLIRMPPQEGREQATLGDAVLQVLKQQYGEVSLRRSEFVGPAVGEELREDGGLAMLIALAVVMVYIMFRFTGKFAIGAVVALIHDVIITIGAFALFHWTFDLTVLAAVLAVIGYSLNDTIVVADRIRENFRLVRKGIPLEIINTSLNQTLTRTLITSFTTLLVLLALLFLGGELIRGFAVALTIGVVIGTYSSIYVAANILLVMNITKADLVLPEKTEADMP